MFKPAVKDIKIVVLNMLKETEKNVGQVEKKINSPRKKKVLSKKESNGYSGIYNSISEIKNSSMELNSRLETAEEGQETQKTDQ